MKPYLLINYRFVPVGKEITTDMKRYSVTLGRWEKVTTSGGVVSHPYTYCERIAPKKTRSEYRRLQKARDALDIVSKNSLKAGS